MPLHNILHSILQKQGTQILKEVRLVNILDDQKVFHGNQSLKYIFKAILSDGYVDKLLSIGCWNNQAEILAQRFSKSTGFAQESVLYILQSIAYSLNWIERISDLTIGTNGCSDNNCDTLIANNVSIQHAIFKGIPITGTKEEFLKAIEGIGLSRSTKNWDNFALFFGSFAEIENCDFRVEFSPFNGQAYEVQIWMPTQDSWNECKSRYFDFKARLISKYGEPESCFEFFEYPYTDAEGNGNELELLRNDKVIFKTLFRTATGAIEIKIHYYGDVHITYEDKINADYHYTKANEVLNSDL